MPPCAAGWSGRGGHAEPGGRLRRFGSLHYDQWMNAYEGLRVAAARLINADLRKSHW